MPLFLTKIQRMAGFAQDIAKGVDVEEAIIKNDVSRSILGLCKETGCTQPRQQASSRCTGHAKQL